MIKLKIIKELQEMLPKLSKEEFSGLEQDILKKGILDSLKVWNDILIDGHHRYEIALKHNLKYDIKNINFEDIYEAKMWIIDHQVFKRNIPDFIKFELILEKEKILLEKGKEKQGHGQTAPGKTLLPIVGKSVDKPKLVGISKKDTYKPKEENVQKSIQKGFPTIGIPFSGQKDTYKLKEKTPIFETKVKKAERKNIETNEINRKPVKEIIPEEIVEQPSILQKHNTHEILAKELGWSKGKFGMAKKVYKESDKETLQKLKTGEVSINEIHNKIKKEKKEQDKIENRKIKIEKRVERDNSFKEEKLPDRKYGVLYVDPPWKYEHSKSHSREIENQYPTMTLDEIKAINIDKVADNDCIIFMWTTSPKLTESIEVLNQWNFLYRTCAVWIKDKIGMGYYFRQQHELLLIAIKGRPIVPSPSDRISSVLSYPRGKHSEKPKEIYNIIDNMYPDIMKLEMFSRGNERKNWEVWGYESK